MAGSALALRQLLPSLHIGGSQQRRDWFKRRCRNGRRQRRNQRNQRDPATDLSEPCSHRSVS
jgi:hypothetical protein